MMSEPASKEWFAKYDTPKSHALHNFEGKKKEIAERMHKGETPRSKQIRENNDRYAMQGKAMTAKARHERRHAHGHRTTLSERKSSMKDMSNDRS